MDNNYYKGNAGTSGSQPTASPSPTAAFAAKRQAYINAQQARAASPSVQLAQNGRPATTSVQLDQYGRPVTPSVQLSQNTRPASPSVQLNQYGRPVSPSVQLGADGKPAAQSPTAAFAAQRQAAINRQASPSVQLGADGKPVAQSPTAAFAAQRQAAINRQASPSVQLDQNGRPVRPSVQLDQNGRPVNPSVQLDQNGRPVTPSVQFEQYTRSSRPSVQLQNNSPAPSRSGGPPSGSVQGGPPPGVRAGGPPSGGRAGGPPPGVGAGGPPPGRRPGGPQGGKPGMGRMGGGARGPRPKVEKGTLKKLLGLLFKEYKAALTLVIICMIIVALVSTVQSVFTERITAIITTGLQTISKNSYNESSQFVDVYKSLRPEIFKTVGLMIGVYTIGLTATFIYTRLNAVITQGFLYRLRKKVFAKMQSLPVKFFDTHNHGDIMSYYTNDIDTLRQLLSQALPTMFSSGMTIAVYIVIMLYYSIPLTLTVCLGVACMFMVTKFVGGNSARFFMQQQMSLGRTEGYIEEMIHGQKVVKVFSHEEISKQDFDKLNNQLFEDARNANKFANILMPIMGNIGNILYVLVAFIGGIIMLNGWANPSVRALVSDEKLLTISVVVSYLGITRHFCQSISQVSQQINSIAMALAGAERVFRVLDEQSEQDDGYVELVNAVNRNGSYTESNARTGLWAWKHKHGNGSVTYTPLQGNVVFENVDFGYVPEKTVLHDISLFAHTGQKIALVGSTGAGKTTITNLINRFYDIQDGKIRYDDINIEKIKKSDLRRSLGVVLQEVNLFTGTVMDNIRYGKLDATDEECIAAARLANADGFIRMLPNGYNTVIKGDGSDLSQGQRQLISIARAAIADPPLMILDEATSSIDTRTELIVQKGMDALMKGRTVFVIAHRLSTIRNSDMILVMEQGRIIERGNHDQLIAARGTYYSLYTGAFELK